MIAAGGIFCLAQRNMREKACGSLPVAAYTLRSRLCGPTDQKLPDAISVGYLAHAAAR